MDNRDWSQVPDVHDAVQLMADAAGAGEFELPEPFFSTKGTFRDVMLGTQAPPPPSPVKLYGKNRNMPCPCGSGRKFKKCCLGKTQSQRQKAALDTIEQRQRELKAAILSGLPQDEVYTAEAGAMTCEKKSEAMEMRFPPSPQGVGEPLAAEAEQLGSPEVIGQILGEAIGREEARRHTHDVLNGDGQE